MIGKAKSAISKEELSRFEKWTAEFGEEGCLFVCYNKSVYILSYLRQAIIWLARLDDSMYDTLMWKKYVYHT